MKGFFSRRARHARRLRAQGEEFLAAFRKHRLYRSDLLAPAQREEALSLEKRLAAAVNAKDAPRLEALLPEGDRLAAALFPARPGDVWRENLEVVFVAIVAALALRAYFLQPFKIPTDSMKPTLYGIQTAAATEPPPSLPVRIFRQVVFGRSYGAVRFDHPVTLTGMRGGSIPPWFEYTDLSFDTGETARVWVSREALYSRLGLRLGQRFAPPQEVVHYVNEAGDQVLVNKLAYNFRLPHRGEVFVFRTNGIEGIEAGLRQRGIFTSEYYIKRCVGVPGDSLRLIPPYLEINGSRTEGVNAAMRRVEAAEHGYQGYGQLRGQNFLATPEETYRIEPDSFWAMGDNSYNSLDSRYWGAVPRPNLVGTGVFVYWPFGPRWGFIR
ncbi:MAG: signal peptidase I [Verrucomicrobium sp.]|nr:signal peptidase I [Verrucomicrobium sp.]